MAVDASTFIGQVGSVTGASVRVKLREDVPTLVLVGGESYRVGQIGAFFRIPLGYTSLFGVCTQVGADAAPPTPDAPELLEESLRDPRIAGYRWMTITLFGESVGGVFERGISQHPTIGDEVHLVTTDELRLIYGSSGGSGVTVGSISAAPGIPASLDLAKIVSRHSAVLGSTGSGKSNYVTVFLESVANSSFPSSRVVLIDPHGEYASALSGKARVFRLGAEDPMERLRVPYWALRFSELQEIAIGGLQPNVEAVLREKVEAMKKEAARGLATPPADQTITADSPVPFSLNRFWFELDDFERQTFSESNNQTEDTKEALVSAGDPNTLTSNRYPAPSSYNTPPYPNRKARYLERQLELLRSRLTDARFEFLFRPGGGLDPAQDGSIEDDLDSLLCDWVGHDKPITVIDTSGVPSEILAIVVGTMLRLIWDVLFWGAELPVGGRRQPLLVVLEEAHRFLREDADTPANRTLGVIAKEGRKYGIGLMVVTQRPTEVDSAVLSQLGTIAALRTTNAADRQRIASVLPDELSSLADILPALRTGEGLFSGEALEIPTRIRIRRARHKPIGEDPRLPDAWLRSPPERALYKEAIRAWREQRMAKGKEEREDA